MNYESDGDQKTAVPHKGAEVSANQWSAFNCPKKKPSFPFSRETRKIFDEHFVDQLRTCQSMFSKYFNGSDEERARAERSLQEELPHVVASEGWLKVLDERLSYDLAFLIILLPVILCIVMPWLVGNHHWWYNILVVLAGAAGYAIALALVMYVLYPIVEPSRVDGSLGLLTMLALSIGSFAALYAKRPAGWEFFAATVAAFGLFCTIGVVLTFVSELSSALIRRVTIGRYFEAELSYFVFCMLKSLSSETSKERLIDIADKSYYAGKLIEQRWQRLRTSQASPPALQRQVHDTVRRCAAGMYEIGFQVTFPAGASNPEMLEDKLATQLTALATFQYGDLIQADPQEVSARPRLQTILRSLRSVIAAIAPVTLLLVLPKAFHLSVSASLYGTLLTVSLAWLAIYVIGWLDPNGLANVSSLTSVTGILGSGKRGN